MNEPDLPLEEKEFPEEVEFESQVNPKEETMQAFPYEDIYDTELWWIIDGALEALEANQDVKITSPRRYVTGYICRSLVEADAEAAEQELAGPQEPS